MSLTMTRPQSTAITHDPDRVTIDATEPGDRRHRHTRVELDTDDFLHGPRQTRPARRAGAQRFALRDARARRLAARLRRFTRCGGVFVTFHS